MPDFVLKNSFFEFNGNIKQKSGTATGTKFVLPYACIFMNDLETVLKSQELQPFLWLHYIGDTFFICPKYIYYL